MLVLCGSALQAEPCGERGHYLKGMKKFGLGRKPDRRQSGPWPIESFNAHSIAWLKATGALFLGADSQVRVRWGCDVARALTTGFRYPSAYNGFACVPIYDKRSP